MYKDNFRGRVLGGHENLEDSFSFIPLFFLLKIYKSLRGYRVGSADMW